MMQKIQNTQKTNSQLDDTTFDIFELNIDLSDICYLLLCQKAIELWNFEKNQEIMCENCDKEDFTSDLTKIDKKSIERIPSRPIKIKKINGFWYDGIYIEINENEDLKTEMENFKLAIVNDRIQERIDKIEKKEEEEYWEKIQEWKLNGMKYNEQPLHPDGTTWFDQNECIEYRSKCKFFDDCENQEFCDFTTCKSYEKLFDD